MNKANVLILDDDQIVHEFFKINLGRKAQLHHSKTPIEFFEQLKKNSIDFAFIDLYLGDELGLDVIKQLNAIDEELPIIAISSSKSIPDIVGAFRFGAIDFLTKPIDDQDLLRCFKRASERRAQIKEQADLKPLSSLKRSSSEFDVDSFLIGQSPKMQSLKEQIKKLKGSPLDILILGESGTGKEVVAKSLNRQEDSKTRPLITLNCSAIPKELMESVLFGHEKGSFTGAVNKQLGKFELASGGDIFLDEMATLNLDLQAKLLRVLQEREIEPIGLGIAKKIEFRTIAATNEEVEDLVSQKRFRLDLYYRLNKVILRIPALRERKEDIPLLVTHFLQNSNHPNGPKAISEDALELLATYHWPGNVRELQNIIENLIYTVEGDEIKSEDLNHFNFRQNSKLEAPSSQAIPSTDQSKHLFSVSLTELPLLQEVERKLEKAVIERAFDLVESKTEVARALGIDRKTLNTKMRLLGLE